MESTFRLQHEPIAVRDADTVVVTGAIWPDNPEYLSGSQSRDFESYIAHLHCRVARPRSPRGVDSWRSRENDVNRDDRDGTSWSRTLSVVCEWWRFGKLRHIVRTRN